MTLYRLFGGEVCILSASCVMDAVNIDLYIDAEAVSYTHLDVYKIQDTVVCGFSLYHILAYFLIYSCIGWCLAVSYTHLDVYKRQEVCFPAAGGTARRFCRAGGARKALGHLPRCAGCKAPH